jgi:exopolysaccharide biosynthesis predicted pyruvyltransferase EpsI
MFDDADPYVTFLTANKGKTFYMKAWAGNTGDLLIWWGTENLLRDLDIQTTRDPMEADVILIPGGNQTMWQGNVETWRTTWESCPDKEFVIGPMTAQFGLTTWVEDICNTSVRVSGLFARDAESHRNLCDCRFGKDIVVGLSHDPALYLRHSDFVEAEKKASKEEYVLAAFRADHEGCRTTSEYNKPLSRLVPDVLLTRIDSRRKGRSQMAKIAKAAEVSEANGTLRTCDIARHPMPYFFEVLRGAKEVHTDRLHCMLAAAMLDKPVFAYPTTFGKLEAVYEHSLKDWARVEFVGGR